MSNVDTKALEDALLMLPLQYRGPGGVVAVVKDGQILERQAWGFADLDRRVPMSTATLMPICSISKQFTCATLLDAVGDPAQLQPALADYLPDFEVERPQIADLCNNQSGLRDYWALTVLCGARPEGVFGPADARYLLGRMRTTHFAPGTHYSYCNGNFRILSDLLENHLGRPLGDLLADHVFQPVGMETAQLRPDTADMAGDAIGYEGSVASGFQPAINRIHWIGDAGILASLDDMIAWERFIDATREDADGLYRRLTVPMTFNDGRPAPYGFGIAHGAIDGIATSGHSGGLRGWRCQRLYMPSERLSVVVMFNHQADARLAADDVMRATLGLHKAQAPNVTVGPGWFGDYLDPVSRLSLTLTPHGAGKLQARFASTPEGMQLGEDGVARSGAMSLRKIPGGVRLERAGENLYADLPAVAGKARTDVEGRFYCSELDAFFIAVSAGGSIYGAFEGFLGEGAMQALYPIGADVWLLPCPRSMDAPAPGDWTVLFERDASGAVTSATIDCWLARGLRFLRQNET